MENKNARQSTGSLFLSIPGLIILVIVLGVSFYFKATIISAFILLFLILCVIAFFWSRKVAKQLRAEVRPMTASCFPDDDILLELTLNNNGSLAAIWTDAYLPIDNPALATPQNGTYSQIEMTNPEWSGLALHQKFTWVSGYQQLTCKLTLTANKRGILSTDYIYLHAGDGFGIGTSRCGNPTKGTCSVVIFPKLYPVNMQNLLLKGSTMNAGKRGQYEDVTLLKNIRPYQHGDNFKRINWRMLAKQQEFMVNLYEQITPESIFFLLDLGSFSYQQHRPGGNDDDMMDCIYEDDMELAISVVASCITALSEQGVACGLVIPGYGDVAPEFFYGESNSLRLEELLLMLAKISYEGGKTDWPGEHLSYLTSGMGKSYVITRDVVDATLYAYDFMEAAIIVSIDKTTEMQQHNVLHASDFITIL